MSNMIGLMDEEIKAQRARYGSNEIQEIPSHPILGILKETSQDPMILFLLVIAALYGWTEQFTEALTLTLALIPLVEMGSARRSSAARSCLKTGFYSVQIW